jgi:hypothetical protein
MNVEVMLNACRDLGLTKAGLLASAGVTHVLSNFTRLEA